MPAARQLLRVSPVSPRSARAARVRISGRGGEDLRSLLRALHQDARL